LREASKIREKEGIYMSYNVSYATQIKMPNKLPTYQAFASPTNKEMPKPSRHSTKNKFCYIYYV